MYAVASSTLFIMAATLGSTLLGFTREVVNARYYGTRWEMDTFLAAATIPTILFGVFNGALVSALVPVFSEYLTNDDEGNAWRLCNTVINVLAVLLVLCAGIGWLLAPYYVPLIAHGFPAPQMAAAVRMTRWLMPSIVAVSLSGVLSAMLNAYHKFRWASLTGIAMNVVTVGCVIFLTHRMGIYAVVLGTALGLFAQLLVQLPPFIALHRYRLEIDLHHPGLKRIWEMLGPIMVGSAAGQLALFFDRFFASTLPPGSMAGMNYATKLVNFPQQIFAAAIATVIFPLLAQHFARDNRRAVARNVNLGLRLVMFIAIPSVVALAVLAHPIVQTLFERGHFTVTSVALTQQMLPYAAFGLVALAANVVLTRCCFACQESAWPVAISVFTVMLNILLSLLWLPTLGARGLLLANSLSQSVQMVMLLALVSRLLNGFAWRDLLRAFLKIATAATAMLLALNWIAALGVHPTATLISRFWFLFGQITIGGAVFFAVAMALKAEELSLAVKLIVAKFERGTVGPYENREAPIA